MRHLSANGMGSDILAAFLFFLGGGFGNIVKYHRFKVNIYPTASSVTDICDGFSQASGLTAFLSTTVVAHWHCRCQLQPLRGHLISR